MKLLAMCVAQNSVNVNVNVIAFFITASIFKLILKQWL